MSGRARTWWAGLASVPWWFWWTLLSLVVMPWYLRYFAWALAGSIEFWAPRP